MPQWHIPLDIDSILLAQGAEPHSIRVQSPRLLQITEQALVEAIPLLNPQVYLKRLKVLEHDGQECILQDGGTLAGSLIEERLSNAAEIVAVLCTIGSELENYASARMPEHPMLSLALDGAGSAAVEILGNAVCHSIEKQARSEDLHASMPIFPGMRGWPIEEGQNQMFDLWNEPLDILLTPSCMMVPRKSLSMVIGLGKHPFQQGSSCDLCSSAPTCRFRERHAK